MVIRKQKKVYVDNDGQTKSKGIDENYVPNWNSDKQLNLPNCHKSKAMAENRRANTEKKEQEAGRLRHTCLVITKRRCQPERHHQHLPDDEVPRPCAWSGPSEWSWAIRWTAGRSPRGRQRQEIRSIWVHWESASKVNSWLEITGLRALIGCGTSSQGRAGLSVWGERLSDRRVIGVALGCVSETSSGRSARSVSLYAFVCHFFGVAFMLHILCRWVATRVCH